MGILSAVKRASIWDYFGRGFALFGQAVPNFWLGIMMIFLFAVRLDWLPSATAGEGFFSFKHYVMPVFVLGTATAGGYLRITRSAMLEVLDAEYVKLARAKGVEKQLGSLETCPAKRPHPTSHRFSRADGGVSLPAP